MKHKKKQLKTLTSTTFAFLLTILFSVLYLSLGFILGVFNDRSIVGRINESNYYNEVYEELNKNTQEIVLSAGLPVTVLQEAVTLERVYVGGKNYIETALQEQATPISTKKLREDLYSNIDQYLTEQNILRTDELNTATENLISEIELQYVSAIELKFIGYYTDYKADFMRLMMVVLPIVLLVIGALCYFLIKMNEYQHRGLRYINYALIASSCLTLLAAAGLMITKKYSKVEISPDYYRDFLTAYLRWDIMIFIYMGGIGLTLSLVMISLTGYLKNRILNR